MESKIIEQTYQKRGFNLIGFEKELNVLYRSIAQKVNDMIPTEWVHFCFNGEVKDGEGGVYFFFTPKGEQQHIFSHYIPKLYSKLGAIDRIKYFEYKYANYNKEELDLSLIEEMRDFEER